MQNTPLRLYGMLALAALLCMGAASEKRRPVLAPGAQAPAPPPPVPGAKEKEKESADKPRGRRPVIGAESAAPPPPPPSTTPVPAAPVEEVEPEEPPAPLEFADGPGLREGGGEEMEELSNPGEVRYHTRIGTTLWRVSIQPGIPAPNDPVEIAFRIEEHLPVPDPYLGDRRPLADLPLQVRVRGGGTTQVFRLHPTASPGNYAFQFTPNRSDTYTLAVQRTDGRAGVQAEFKVPVGLPPLESTRALRVERRIGPQPAPGVRGAMQELAKQWMALDRHAGTPQAQVIRGALLEQARAMHQGTDDLEIEELTAALIAGIEAIPADGSADAVRAQMLEVQNQVCLRCHAKHRLEFADSTIGWPRFEVRRLLPPKRSSTPTTSTPRRGPVAPAQR